jgi:hypothetical protein
MYVAWRMSSEPTVRNPRRYAERIRKSEYEQHRQSLEDEWFDDPKQVLVSSFGLTPGQALEAAVEYRAVRNDTD